MVVSQLIAKVTKLAEEDSREARATWASLIIADLKEIGDRLVAAERRLDALEQNLKSQ